MTSRRRWGLKTLNSKIFGTALSFEGSSTELTLRSPFSPRESRGPALSQLGEGAAPSSNNE